MQGGRQPAVVITVAASGLPFCDAGTCCQLELISVISLTAADVKPVLVNAGTAQSHFSRKIAQGCFSSSYARCSTMLMVADSDRVVAES